MAAASKYIEPEIVSCEDGWPEYEEAVFGF
jgi:hypothetical protein